MSALSYRPPQDFSTVWEDLAARVAMRHVYRPIARLLVTVSVSRFCDDDGD